MPELAEVEYYRKQWSRGLKQKILAVELHSSARIFRGADIKELRRVLTGAVLAQSEAHGKQMFFQFSGGAWLGLHLGMTGRLRIEPAGATADRHDHLLLRQRDQCLVFSDPRQFGRVRFHPGPAPPPWRTNLPAAILSNEFTPAVMERFLRRRGGSPLKAVLLMQEGFPGIGNWMADEVLWRAGLRPSRPAGRAKPAEIKKLYRELRGVCRVAMQTIARDYRDPPPGWFFHRRWRAGGACPRDGSPLRRAEIGGRTTCWCPSCQT